MKIINMNHVGDHGSAQSVIGIYYPNGVFLEKDSERGISYILDHALYLSLQKAISDQGKGMVRATTHYGYTCFLIMCPPDKANDNFRCAEDILLGQQLCVDDLGEWIDYRKANARKCPTPVDTLYYAQRAPSTPLSRTLSAGINCVPSLSELRAWSAKHIIPENVISYISGSNIFDLGTNDGRYAKMNRIPSYAGSTTTLPKNMPWRWSHLIYSVPFSVRSIDTLAIEACNQWLKSQIASRVNHFGGKLCSVQFCLDCIPEWQIRIQCSTDKTKLMVDEISGLITESKGLSQQQVNHYRSKVFNYYRRMSIDPVRWNRFAGYNAMTGSRYELRQLCNAWTYAQQITPDSVMDVLSQLQRTADISVFAAPVR